MPAHEAIKLSSWIEYFVRGVREKIGSSTQGCLVNCCWMSVAVGGIDCVETQHAASLPSMIRIVTPDSLAGDALYGNLQGSVSKVGSRCISAPAAVH